MRDQGEGDGTFRLRIGRNVTFERDVYLRIHARGTNELDIGDKTLLQSGCRLWLLSGSVRLGSNTILRDLACLKSGGDLHVGDHVRIGWCTSIHCHERITIDDYAGLADLIMVVDSDHVQDGSDTWYSRQPVHSSPIHLATNALLGSNCVVMRGARVGRNSMVAAGSVVRNGEYPDAWIIGGVPAKPLRALGDGDGR